MNRHHHRLTEMSMNTGSVPITWTRRGIIGSMIIGSMIIPNSYLCAAETATNVNPLTGAAGLPGATAISDIQASGPIHLAAKASYACQLRGHGGADWNDQTIPGDGKGRWMQGICLLGAYFHEKPQKMMDEIPRMLKMRNSLGYFGPEYGPDKIRGGDWFDHNHVVNVREASLSPGPRQPGSRWVSWGETAADFGGLQGLSRLPRHPASVHPRSFSLM